MQRKDKQVGFRAAEQTKGSQKVMSSGDSAVVRFAHGASGKPASMEPTA
jgi:hypothetical protein